MAKLAKMGFEIEAEWNDFAKLTAQKNLQFKGDGSLRLCQRFRLKDPDELVNRHTGNASYGSCLRNFEAISGAFAAEKVEEWKSFFAALQQHRDKNDFHYNSSCGFHIHVSFDEFPSEVMSARFWQFFMVRYKKAFPKEYSSRHNGQYCKVPTPLAKSDMLRKVVKYTGEKAKRDAITKDTERYRGINLWAAWQKHRTVEFRIFPTTEPQRMYEMLLFTERTVREFLEKETFKVDFSFTIAPRKKVLAVTEKEKAELPKKRKYSFAVSIPPLPQENITVVVEATEVNYEVSNVGIRTQINLFPKFCPCCADLYERCGCENCEYCYRCYSHGKCDCRFCGCCDSLYDKNDICANCKFCPDCDACLEHDPCDCEEDIDCECSDCETSREQNNNEQQPNV